MGLSKKSNNKADQETQSPVITVFKEIMRLSENPNSEKANLLKQKTKKKKRFGSKSKGEKSESSNSERLYKVMQQQTSTSQHKSQKSQSEFPGEKRETRWLWSSEGEKNLEDTCSCVSCALKKLIMSQRSGFLLCVAATLAILGTVAICCVVNTLPKTYFEDEKAGQELEDEDGTTKVPASERRDRRSEYSYGRQGIDDGPVWDANKARLMAELNSPGLNDNRADGEKVQGHGRMNSMLSSIIDSNKLGQGYRSSAIREFYRKLIKTDLEISKLKKSIHDTTTVMVDHGNGMLEENFRPRRSLQYLPEKQNGVPIDPEEMFRNLNIYFPPAIAMRIPEKSKRHAQTADGKTGKKKKKASQHKPRFWRRIFKIRKERKESSTSPGDHTHLKNSERLDKLLDEFVIPNKGPQTRLIVKTNTLGQTQTTKKNKQKNTTPQYDPTQNIKEKEIDPVSIDNELENRPAKKKQKKPKNKIKRLDLNAFIPWRRQRTENKISPGDGMSSLNSDVKKTTQSFTGALSISTILQAPVQQSENSLEMQVPNLRRLLQLEGDEDIEDTETVEDADENGDDEDKKKRNRNNELDMLQLNLKYRLPDINNPNWKGPMPLYPDELNTITKNSAVANIHSNKGSMSHNSKDLSDTEYVEDYVNNKYDKLAKMAQAYSDYGVLENKQEKTREKTPKHLDDKVKVMVQRGLTALGRRKMFKAGVVSDIEDQRGERMRFEVQPKYKRIKLKEPNFFRLASHVKIARKKKVTLPKAEEHFELSTSPKGLSSRSLSKHPSDIPYNDDHSWNHFGNNYKRSLKSVIDDTNDGEKECVTVVDDIMGNFTEADQLKTVTDNYNNTKNVLPATATPIDAADETIAFDVHNRQDDNATLPSPLYNIDSTKDPDNNDGSMNDNASYVNDVVSTSTDTNEVLKFISDIFQILNKINVHGKESRNETCASQDQLDKLNLTTPLPYMLYNITSTTSKDDSTLFDSEVVPNVGYRSRVLMSVKEDKPNNDNDTAVTKHIDEELSIKKLPLQTKVEHLNATTGTIKVNVSNAEDNNKLVPDYKVVKRSISDNSNQIFWNDIYDEEYGVKDPLENAGRVKPSEKSEDLIAKSGNWLGVKFRKIGDRVRHSYGRMMEVESNDGRNHNKISKRADTDSKFRPTFESLHAKMQMVCREAAEAIQKTRSKQARSENDETQALMKQLINMMSDLVEVQVKKRTCVALPADLRNFLRMLTTVNVEDRSSTYSFKTGLPVGTQRSPEDVYPDLRTECLGTIQDVQQLIELYDEMSEEDKSKMSGVREYLESQLDFLHRQLSAFDDYAIPVRYVSPIRRRKLSRDAKKNRRVKRRIHKFVNFGRKRTKSPMTDESYETLTDSYKSEDNILKKEEEKSGKEEKYDSKRHSKDVKDGVTKDDEVKDEDAKTKRNLQDIYYRALAEAKNVTTAGSLNTITRN